MRPNTHLRQALAQLIGGALADGAAAITGREQVPALRPRGRRVEHARALSTLDALELGNGVQLMRRADEEVAPVIYPAIQEFLGSGGEGSGARCSLASRPQAPLAPQPVGGRGR
jgi:hypothetical protein